MYKLIVISGPNRGQSFDVATGEVSIGRAPDNVIALPSTKVSKKHCTLVVDNTGITLKDQGSSNGTFVNGVLTRLKKVQPGDRISVGEYVFELARPRSSQSQSQFMSPIEVEGQGGFGKVLPFPVQAGAPQPGGDPAAAAAATAVPRTLGGKLSLFFDSFVMPIFYSLALGNEIRYVALGLFGAFAVGNLFISVYPLMESGRKAVVIEVGRRAQFMAKQIADRNAGFLAAGAETKTDLGGLEREDGVRMALITDLDSRIIAPYSKMNQYLTAGDEAQFAVRARNLFRKGRETGLVSETEPGTVVAIEPVKVFSPQQARNVVAGMALVSLDSGLSTPTTGEMGVAYSQVLILTTLLGAVVLLILYRLLLKPFEALNDDMDRALKGELQKVTREFKISELDSLWDLIDSALQRIPRGGSVGGSDGLGGFGSVSLDDLLPPFRLLGDLSKFGLVLCGADRKVAYVNMLFEEVTGIRGDSALGQEFSAVARDQAFSAFVSDLLDRAQAGGQATSEDFDFSGVSYKIFAVQFGPAGGSPLGYLLAVSRNEG